MSGSADPPLHDTVKAMKEQLGLKDGNFTEILEAACKKLGVDINGKSLQQQARECRLVMYGSAGGGSSSGHVPAGVVVQGVAPVNNDLSNEVSPNVPIVVGVIVDEQAFTNAAPSAPQLDPLVEWLANYPVVGGPRSDQLQAYGWFDSQGWQHSRPLHRAATRGEVGAIRSLCDSGRDPNEKMSEWYDSEPLGWAASLGHLGAVITLIQCGADPSRPKNKAGFTPLTDAAREKHQHVVNFLNEYSRKKANGAVSAPPQANGGVSAPQQQMMGDTSIYDKSRYANGGPRHDQNACCLGLICLPCMIICPLDLMAACGWSETVDKFTSNANPFKYIPCSPCDPNSKNPLWFCSEPIGWAASFGQLHTVMVLCKNGANPNRKNLSGNNAFTDAARERHSHVTEWLNAWKRYDTEP